MCNHVGGKYIYLLPICFVEKEHMCLIFSLSKSPTKFNKRFKSGPTYTIATLLCKTRRRSSKYKVIAILKEHRLLTPLMG